MCMIFDSPEINKKVVRKGKCYNHYFCALCGKELTKFNLKKGLMTQQRHFLITLKNGMQFRRCWNSTLCDKRRKAKRGVDIEKDKV